MSFRACPLCFAKVPRTPILTHGDELVCPSCHALLEASRSSRALSAFTGLLAGFGAARIGLRASLATQWVLAMVAAVLGFAMVSALVLLFFTDVVVAPKPSPPNFPHSHK
jgi:hypothetical protein